MNETTKNFWEAWNSFQWPEPVKQTYRLYYNDDGSPKCYTMEDLPGKYIEVDRETYINHVWNVQVKDEQLTIIPIKKTVLKLTAGGDDGTCCHPQDICVVVDPARPHVKWNMTQYEIS